MAVATDTYIEGMIVTTLNNADGSVQWMELETYFGGRVRVYPTFCCGWQPGPVVRCHIIDEQRRVDTVEVIGWGGGG